MNLILSLSWHRTEPGFTKQRLYDRQFAEQFTCVTSSQIANLLVSFYLTNLAKNTDSKVGGSKMILYLLGEEDKKELWEREGDERQTERRRGRESMNRQIRVRGKRSTFLNHLLNMIHYFGHNESF